MDEFQTALVALLPRARRFARSLAHNMADADDVVQIAVERALKAQDQWQPGTRLDSWLYRIIRNAWIDETRSRRRRQMVFADEEEGRHVGMDTSEALDARADLAKVNRAMQTLPAEQREAVALVLVEGLAYREAAEILDIPIGTLTSRLLRGRAALAQALGPVMEDGNGDR